MLDLTLKKQKQTKLVFLWAGKQKYCSSYEREWFKFLLQITEKGGG